MIERFVGVPYLANGRHYDGADCWGILCLFYRDVLGLELPSLLPEMQGREFHRRGIAPLVQDVRESQWHEVSEPRQGDCVLMRVGRLDTHVGIYLDRGRLLHSEGPHPSEIVRIDDIRVKRRISGFYRLNAC